MGYDWGCTGIVTTHYNTGYFTLFDKLPWNMAHFV